MHPVLARLQGLLELDQRGVEVRPILLRVLTDEYVSSPRHTLYEQQQYQELATALLSQSDVATRAAIAARLAHYPAAPRALVLQLARDLPEIAEPILKHSWCLTPSDCAAIASERGARHVELIAERGTSPLPIESAAPPPALPTRRASAPVPDASDLCEQFFGAASSERRLILLMLDYLPAVTPTAACNLQRSDILRIEAAALAHNTAAVARELEHALAITGHLARRIVDDELGEPFVVAAKAMTLPRDIVQRMLLFVNPTIGQSIDRVYQLAALCDEITTDAAHRLVAIWAEAAAKEPAASQRGPAAPRPLLRHAGAESPQRVPADVVPPHARVELRGMNSARSGAG